MTRQEILEAAREAGWDCRYTKETNEMEFGCSIPLEMSAIERFVEIIEKRTKGSSE